MLIHCLLKRKRYIGKHSIFASAVPLAMFYGCLSVCEVWQESYLRSLGAFCAFRNFYLNTLFPCGFRNKMMSHTSMCLHSAVALNLLFSRHIEGEMAEIRGERHTYTNIQENLFIKKGRKLWTKKVIFQGHILIYYLANDCSGQIFF